MKKKSTPTPTVEKFNARKFDVRGLMLSLDSRLWDECKVIEKAIDEEECVIFRLYLRQLQKEIMDLGQSLTCRMGELEELDSDE